MNWTDKTDAEIKTAMRGIVMSSESDDEIERRAAEELGYPYGLAITSRNPTDNVGREAQSIVAGLGGLIRKDGAMVMIMMHGPRGNTLSI